MGLILPGSPGWAHCTSNISGTPSTTPGTAVTASATANTDGTSVSLLTALSHDVEYLIIGVHGFGASTNNTSALLDILVDPAGGTSWLSTPIINDLLVGYTGAIGVSGVTIAPVTRWYHFPLWIKSGASIGARVRCATGSQAGRVIVHAFGGNASPSSWWCGQFVTEIAINAGTSKGTDHTAGSHRRVLDVDQSREHAPGPSRRRPVLSPGRRTGHHERPSVSFRVRRREHTHRPSDPHRCRHVGDNGHVGAELPDLLQSSVRGAASGSRDLFRHRAGARRGGMGGALTWR
jgi:hypothetical protein